MDYYDLNAESYAASTLALDMGGLWEAFEALVPKGGRILDAGCGAGRDALHFLGGGYRVSAFDKSPAMASIAARLTGLRVGRMAFEEFEGDGSFDGVWACASLLHVPRPALEGVFGRLAGALRVGGVLYCSFKSGEEDYQEEGRFYTCFTRSALAAFLRPLPFLEMVDIWETEDVRPLRRGRPWVNALLRRTAQAPPRP